MTKTARPRILLDLLPYSPSDGGFTTSIHALLRVAAELPEFDFGLAYHRDFQGRFGTLPFRQHPVRFPRKLKFFAPLAIVPALVRRHGYQAVHGDISVATSGAGVPTSMRVHDLYYLVSGEKRQDRLIQGLFEQAYRDVYVRGIRRASIAAAVSECTRRDMVRLVHRRGNIPLLPHAIDLPACPPTARAWPGPGVPVRLLFVGSIVPRKNLRVLLEALPLLRRPWTLDLVGNAWWGTPELAGQLRDPRIAVHGFVSDESLARHLAEAHLLINPSLYEGFGLPAAEAVRDGCLALTASGSAFDEFVPAGARFHPRAPQELADLINGMTAERYRGLFAEAFGNLGRYSRGHQREAYRALFRALVAAEGNA
jgi:glycosyltransferase involved in cell wall biosynthesis